MKTIIELIKEAKKHGGICKTYDTITSYQLDNKDGETEWTIDVYSSDSGYIYYIEITNETNGNIRKISGLDVDKWATDFYGGVEPLLDK